MFESEYAKIAYMEKDGVVFHVWKKEAHFEDYRKPVEASLNMLKEHEGSMFIVDARNGFEDVKEDVDWGFSYFLPELKKTGCRIWGFILPEVSDIEGEIDLWTSEIEKNFEVIRAVSYEEILNRVTCKQLLDRIAIPRAVGTEGNNNIIEYLNRYFENNRYTMKRMPFSCMVWDAAESYMEWEDRKQLIMASPYAKGFHGEGTVQVVDTLEQLQSISCEASILILTGSMASEPLQPKDYPFYYPDEHKRIIDLLEEKNPLAIIAVTGKHPMCGLNPYPLFEDGNFHIPSAYLSPDDFSKIEEKVAGKCVKVHLASTCEEAASEQIVATKSVTNASGKIVICAHMDSKNDTTGALDNASGIVTALKLTERLQLENYDLDIVPFNSEEYYGANGELLYLEELRKNEDDIKLLINIDSVGHIGSKVEASLYNVSDDLQRTIAEIVEKREDIRLGEAWYAGDHAVFAFQGVCCIAIGSSDMWEGGLDGTHTRKDTVQTVDEKLLLETVDFIEEVVTAFEKM